MDKKKKTIIIAIVAVVVIVVATIVIVLNLNKEEAYRFIKVYEVDGEATIVREDIGEITAYDNMVLESGDYITMNQGTMTVQLDEDKYIYVEEGAELQLVASGTATDSKTTIQLNKGAITNEIQNKLSMDSSYEVNTPNATMSVRGTIFYVQVYEGDDGVLYTKVCVLEGIVETNLIYADGTKANASKILSVENGNKVTIYEDDVTTDYLGEIEPIDYNDLPEDIQQKLQDDWKIEVVNDSKKQDTVKDAEEESIQEEKTGPFTVTFMYEGQVFGTQIVEKGKQATEPSLMPALNGSWDYDFTQEVTDDITIEWK